MQDLADMSRDVTMASRVEHLILASDDDFFRKPITNFTQLPSDVGDYPGSTSELGPSGNAWPSFGGGWDRILLARVFSRLTNLKTVLLRDHYGPDGLTTRSEAPASPYTFQEEWEATVHARYGDHMFAVNIASLADARARPETLQAIFSTTECLHDLAFHIPGDLQPSLEPVLANLKKFEATLALEGGLRGCRCLRRLLSLTTQLEDLVLHFDWSSREDGCLEILTWLGRQPHVSKHGNESRATGPVLLQQLELYRVSWVTSQILRALVKKFSPTLRTLRLEGDNLHDEEGAILHDGEGTIDAVHVVNGWAPLFRYIARNTRLTAWGFRNLWMRTPAKEDGVRVDFEHSQRGKEYDGLDATAKLEALVDSMTLNHPKTADQHGQDEDGSDYGSTDTDMSEFDDLEEWED
jgi:hypothetical protein